MSQSGILADLALRISTNTAELTAGLDKAKAGINKFSKEAQEKSKAVGEGFNSLKEGVANMASSVSGKLGEVTGDLTDMASSIPSVISGIKGMTAGMNVLKVAIAGTGIGLLVIALASLIAYLTQSSEGANMLSKAMAVVGAAVQVLLDTFISFGKVVFEAIRNPMKTIKEFGDAIKNFVMSKVEQLLSGIKGLGTALKHLFAGEFRKAADVAVKSAGDIVKATSPIAWGLEAVSASVDLVKKKYGEASAEAKKALELERATQKLAKDRRAWLKEEGEINVELAELKKKMSMEIKYTAKERLKFLDQSLKLTQKLSNKNVALAAEELRIKKEMDKLSPNTDLQKTAELERQVLDVKKEQQELYEELEGKRVEITDQGKGEIEEQKKKNEEKAKEVELQREYNQLLKDAKNNSFVTQETRKVDIKPTVATPTEIPYKITVKGVDPETLKQTLAPIDAETAALFQRMDDAAAQTSQMINDAFTNAISGFAEALGKVAAGDAGGMKDFLNGILMMVIDFASQFGKLLISIGTAKIALETIGISGIGAVIAGGALVALTSMASALLSKGIDKKANGGISSGGLTLVGERGPELVNLPAGSNVTRANKTEQLLKGNNNLNVTGHVDIRGEDLRIIFKENERRSGNVF